MIGSRKVTYLCPRGPPIITSGKNNDSPQRSTHGMGVLHVQVTQHLTHHV